MTRLTDLPRPQKAMALAMMQARPGWRGREKVSVWWSVTVFVLWAVVWFVAGGLIL